MYRRLKSYARVFLGTLSPELKKYYLEYQRDFNDFEGISSKQELTHAIEGAQIVFCGDYHTLSQAQRTVIRLLREVVPAIQAKNRRVILALEMVRATDDPKIARFLEGRLSESAFLEQIAFRRSWGFSWENYRRLFEFAKEHSLSVVGINLSGGWRRFPTLGQRDRFAARRICELTEKDPKATIVVLVGDLHLASKHLPRQLDIQLQRRGLTRRKVTIHQNSERFYWKLVDKGLEQLVDAVRVREDVYCVMNTPPWVKLQSHVKWAELIVEAGPEGRGEKAVLRANKAAASADVFDTIDHHEEIHEILQVVSQFCGIRDPVDDSFQIHGPVDMGFVGHLEIEHGFSQREVSMTARCLKEFESHFIPRANIIYLSSLSLNHAATQASIYLHGRLSGFSRVFTQPKMDFYPFVWIEALGFLGSKIINHKRKCSGRSDLEALLGGKRSREEWVTKAVLAHLDAEERSSMSGKTLRWIGLPSKWAGAERTLNYFKVAKLLGQLLGNALYLSVIENQSRRTVLRELFGNCFVDPEEARKLYFNWAKRLDRHRYRDVTKTELL